MTLLLIAALLLLLLLQALRALSGTRLLVAGVLTVALLFPLSKWLMKAEVVRQTVQATETTPKPSLRCRMFTKFDNPNKHGVLRTRFRHACKEDTQ